MSSQSPADRFYTNFDCLGQDLARFITKAQGLGFNLLSKDVITLAKIWIDNTYTRVQIIESFIWKSFPLWDRINRKMLADQIFEALKKHHAVNLPKDPDQNIVVLRKIVKEMSPQEIKNFIFSCYAKWTSEQQGDLVNKITEMLQDQDKMNEMDRLVEENVGILFPIVDPQYFEPFAELWKVYMTDTDKSVVWKYVYSFVKISIKYIHETRRPAGPINNWKYTTPFMNTIYERVPGVNCPEDGTKKCRGCQQCGSAKSLDDKELKSKGVSWNIKLEPLNT